MQGWGGGPYGGFPDFGYLDSFRPQAPYQLFGTQSGNFSPLSLSLGYSRTGPPSYDRYGQHYISVLYQQTGWDPFPYPVTSSTGSVSMASTQGIAIRTIHIPGCLNVIPDRLSQTNQPTTTEWSVHPQVVNRIFGTWGTPTVDMFATTNIFPGPIVTRRVCLGWQVVPSVRMEALIQHYKAAGFSEEVSRHAAAPKRPSTNRMASLHSLGCRTRSLSA